MKSAIQASNLNGRHQDFQSQLQGNVHNRLALTMYLDSHLSDYIFALQPAKSLIEFYASFQQSSVATETKVLV